MKDYPSLGCALPLTIDEDIFSLDLKTEVGFVLQLDGLQTFKLILFNKQRS
jgi:hypothetical protein